MHRSALWRVALLSVAFCVPAAAQVIVDMPHVIIPKTKFDDSKGPTSVDVWPRLDPGAVICKTEADLQLLVARRRGEAVAERPNCQLIQAPTAISIVRRAGLGQTEVAVTDQNNMDGWTDAYLPDRAPPIGGRGVQIK